MGEHHVPLTIDENNNVTSVGNIMTFMKIVFFVGLKQLH
jgi:hypothetical protein